MTISCNKCGIYEEEKIINIVNYSSKWVTNSFVNIQPCSQDHSPEDKDSIYVDKKEKKKTLFHLLNFVKHVIFFYVIIALKSIMIFLKIIIMLNYIN